MDWIFGLALVVTTLVAYQPTWNGKPIWDDDGHLTRPELRSLSGLLRIWIEPGTTQQYYPLLHSAFWVEHKLWADSTLGYHLVNILLHAGSALLFLTILRKLEVPGARLAAAIFALHPVCVESVAWMTELKNTLSAIFYLGSTWVYLNFDRNRKGGWYALALGLFLLGLMSKTVVATLPAAVLVIIWWKRGRVVWRRDVLPLIPFFVAGVAAGLVTAWMERKFIGAAGREFEFSIIDRLLIAGRAIWFYLGKLAWPVDLIFIYPRWEVSHRTWWQFLYPAALLLLVAVTWMLRRRWRGPLVALLFFAGTLVPALGFFNVYSFRYSFVADHFQYLASLGIIALFAAGAALLLDRWQLWGRTGGNLLCLSLLATLACLTWRQSGIYTDNETLFRTTIARNPGGSMAHLNLGNVLSEQGRVDEAMVHFQKVVEINPEGAKPYYNLGNALLQRRQLDAAIAYYQRALEARPDFAEAHQGIANALLQKGRTDEAIAHFQRVLELHPGDAMTHLNLGNAHVQKRQVKEAMAHYQLALKNRPDFAEACLNLGNILIQLGQAEQAVAQYRKALEIRPDFAEARNNLGHVLLQLGRADEAIIHFQKALELNPNDAIGQNNLGDAFLRRRQVKDAIAHYQKAVEIQPDHARALNTLAWIFATSSEASFRNGDQAVKLAQQANTVSGGQSPVILATLAAAYAETEQFSQAITNAQKAMQLATTQANEALVNILRTHIRLYQAGFPYRDTSQTDWPASQTEP